MILPQGISSYRITWLGQTEAMSAFLNDLAKQAGVLGLLLLSSYLGRAIATHYSMGKV